MSDERLDRLIDDVAKHLTAGQPSSDFRARVIARLDRPPRRAWRTSWIAVPLGAMAVTMIALAVARPFKGGRDRGAESAAPRQSSQAMKKETAPLSPTPDTTTVRLKPDTTYQRSQQGRRVAAADRRDPLSGAVMLEALAPPPLDVPPLGVEAIGIDALPTGSIALPQLDAITPIAVEPLPTDDDRSASGQRPSPNDR